MEYRSLGRSGLKVSTITIGTMTFGGGSKIGGTSEAEAARQVDLCIDSGVNLLDTADIYSGGASEEIVGRLLAEGDRRRKLLVSTKLGLRDGDGPNDIGTSRLRIVTQAEQSLRRLRIEAIDLYQVHAWDGQTPIDETMEALDRLVTSGKVRYVGSSNFSGWHLSKALRTSERAGGVPLISQPIHYSLQARDAEHDLVPISLDAGLGMLIWSPLAGGLLSGKYSRDARPATGRHVGGFPEPPVRDWDKLYAIVDVLRTVAAETGHEPSQIALAWLLGRRGVTSVIIGGRTQAHFEQNLAAADIRLEETHILALDRVSAQPLPYPYWHQINSVAERLGPSDVVPPK
ncbi:MAG: aldo/keto reductase [Devosia sp.]|nr:aldo/keto reductase [Devosia sp.]